MEQQRDQPCQFRARAQEFSEWAQCQVLEAVSGYRPSGEGEVFELLNVLDDRLAHSNSAVVMATVKLFLHLTLTMPATHQQARPRSPTLYQRCVKLCQEGSMLVALCGAWRPVVSCDIPCKSFSTY